MPMKNPPHPGRSVRDSCLGAVNLTVTDGAKFEQVELEGLAIVACGHETLDARDLVVRSIK